MKEPTFSDAFEVLCLQAADAGRGPILFGDSVERARKRMRPFLVGEEFPSVYLEFPLIGDPFLDVTVLYSKLEPGTYIDSPSVIGCEKMLDWYANLPDIPEEICFGFELDTSKPEQTASAVHFQPRTKIELVKPFCEALGEPDRAHLYLDLAQRMPDGWPLSFFGMFRGRPGTPLRVCGYLNPSEKGKGAPGTEHLAEKFDSIGFTSYNAHMLDQVNEVLSTAPGTVDFQFDVFPDGTLGDTFALDLQFEIEQPEAVQDTFETGAGARVMELFESWGIADVRWKLIAGAAFARGLPVERADGSLAKYTFTLMPAWVKARWRKGELQPSKLYYLGKAGVLEKD